MRQLAVNGIVKTYYLRNKTYKESNLTIEGFIKIFTDHIPDIGFWMIRYYDFLSNRLRSKLQPKVHALLGQEIKYENIVNQLTYAQLIFKDFGVNPLDCILSGAELRLSCTIFGRTCAY